MPARVGRSAIWPSRLTWPISRAPGRRRSLPVAVRLSLGRGQVQAQVEAAGQFLTQERPQVGETAGLQPEIALGQGGAGGQVHLAAGGDAGQMAAVEGEVQGAIRRAVGQEAEGEGLAAPVAIQAQVAARLAQVGRETATDLGGAEFGMTGVQGQVGAQVGGRGGGIRLTGRWPAREGALGLEPARSSRWPGR